MSQKHRSQLIQMNRVLIFVLSLIGMSMDGYTGADIVLTAALVVWLWLPQCTRIECRIIEHLDANGTLLPTRATDAVKSLAGRTDSVPRSRSTH